MACKVKDKSLAEKGRLNAGWAARNMPVLALLRKRFEKEKPFKGVRIGACLHVTKETAVLMDTLKAGGAELYLCGSNPLSTQDDIAAHLAKEGTNVFAWRGQTGKEYAWCIGQVLDAKPEITIDDGADLTVEAHKRGLKAWGGTEETTTGVMRLRAMDKSGKLRYPLIAVNDAKTKMMFDNRYGTGQSTIDGILRASAILIAGKNFVVAGYGWCGKGVAMRAKGMGAHVIVTEVDPVKALEAAMDGFEVMPMGNAAGVGDVFVTVTGDVNVITNEHYPLMKDGAILANSGHFDVEVAVKALKRMAKSVKAVRPGLEEYSMPGGKKLYLLGEGRLVNLACAEGHPSEVMQMSFADQALSAEYLVKSRGKLKPHVIPVPEEIDRQVAKLALKAMGYSIDELSEEQKKYICSWEA